MGMVGVGVIELMILVGLGGGAGVPLGVPPAPEDPTMFQVAPEECLFYTTWAGMAEPDAASANQTEQILAEPEVRYFLTELDRRFAAALKREGERQPPDEAELVNDLYRWAKTIATNPAAVFLMDLSIGPNAVDIRGGAVVRLSREDVDAAQEALERHLEMIPSELVEIVQIEGIEWRRLTLDPQAPQITLGFRGNHFMIGLGKESVEGMLARAKTPMPGWLADAMKRLPVERRATVTYANVPKLVDLLAKAADAPGMGAVLEATGLADVTALTSVTGLEGEDFVCRTLLRTEGEPRGLLKFATAKPLSPADLRPIPADATVALAARLDAGALFDAIFDAVGQIEPGARDQALQGIHDINDQIGIDIRDDLLGSLGDTWCVYNSPSDGGLILTGLTAVVPIKDGPKLANAHKKLLTAMRAQMGDGPDILGPQVRQFPFAGHDVYFYFHRGEEDEFPFAPTWCLTDKELVVSLFPQNVRAYLSREAEAASLAKAEDVASLFAQGDSPIALSYCDTRTIFETVYPVVPIAAHQLFGQMVRAGFDFDVSILPSVKSVGRHLTPAVTTVRRSEDGIELTSRRPIPTGAVGLVFPLGFISGAPMIFPMF